MALPALATERRLTVVVTGGSERAEERLLLQTTYLQEISAYFPGVAVHLVLSGPEMSKAGHKATKAWSGLRVTRFRGTAGDVMRELPEAFEGPCVAVGFNTGFGSGDARLVASCLVAKKLGATNKFSSDVSFRMRRSSSVSPT